MKRRTILSMMMCLLPLWMLAQTSPRPLLEEGKKWHYSYFNYWTGTRHSFQEYLSGDTLIAGRTYMKNWHGGEVRNLLREEGGKVYEYVPATGGEHLLYDFTLSAGERTDEGWGEREYVMVRGVDEADVLGERRKLLRVAVCCLSHDGSSVEGVFDSSGETWIEGMGSENGLTELFPKYNERSMVQLDYIEMPDGRIFRFPSSE